jgi:hypothetical protein
LFLEAAKEKEERVQSHRSKWVTLREAPTLSAKKLDPHPFAISLQKKKENLF